MPRAEAGPHPGLPEYLPEVWMENSKSSLDIVDVLLKNYFLNNKSILINDLKSMWTTNSFYKVNIFFLLRYH